MVPYTAPLLLLLLIILLALHSFPTRRSSDLPVRTAHRPPRARGPGLLRDRPALDAGGGDPRQAAPRAHPLRRDRKSTRLNSSHVAISYAVYCLKKKKK